MVPTPIFSLLLAIYWIVDTFAAREKHRTSGHLGHSWITDFEDDLTLMQQTGKNSYFSSGFIINRSEHSQEKKRNSKVRIQQALRHLIVKL